MKRTRSDRILKVLAEAFAEATFEATVESTEPEATWITAGVYFPLKALALKIRALPNGEADSNYLLKNYTEACERLSCTPLLVASCENCVTWN